MSRHGILFAGGLLLVICAVGLVLAAAEGQKSAVPETAPSAYSTPYAGSVSCRKCHEKFYQLWSTSHHGLAMQPYTAEFAKKHLTPQTGEISVGSCRYAADINDGAGWVVERCADGEKKYPIEHAMGGKNVYYFLTSLDRGRLQTLPVAYDVKKKEWFDMAASGVRHFPGPADQPVNWKEWPYTFNTACYGCHVSQLTTNYELKTDTYRTVWREPGINCETCHGPSDEHVRVCEAAPKGTIPKDLRITRGGRGFTSEQNNATCSSCHAKAVVLTTSFNPGDKFFDHFDLVALESPDYYPDGRDLGENYTYTSWMMSPCVKSGKLDCLHCHTSSGRYRFKAEEKANQACMPCHRDKVENSTQHTFHKPDSPGNKCISCHMPTTEFARMRRSDHSMLPPAPAATIAFKSPNACNICHKDKTPEWADEAVRRWRKRDYQAVVIQRAGLIAAARARDWSRLPEMIDSLESKDRNEVFTTSMIRLLRPCPDERQWPAVLKAIKDPSPLIRSAAVESLAHNPSRESAQALLQATTDESLLVRIRAASSLSGFSANFLDNKEFPSVQKAAGEYLQSLLARPDQWASHYNLGNFFLNQGNTRLALAAFETATKLNPGGIIPLVNVSIAHARMGDLPKAQETLTKALQIDSKNAAANYNMGLPKAEQGDLSAAETFLRLALEADPLLGEAAYNLGVLISKDRPDEALTWAKKAVDARPQEPKYSYTLAFFEHQRGNSGEAIRLLERSTARNPADAKACLLLGEIYEKQGQKVEAEKAYRKILAREGLSRQDKEFIEAKIKKLLSP